MPPMMKTMMVGRWFLSSNAALRPSSKNGDEVDDFKPSFRGFVGLSRTCRKDGRNQGHY
jgi:hypothetical protein